MKKVLITGSKGQLGRSLQCLAEQYKDFEFLFEGRDTLDITDKANVKRYFEDYRPDFVVNTSAYTQVDKAEEEQDKAYAINVLGVENLLESCRKYGAKLVQISTDYVFDGASESPYTESDSCNPINYYGKTKYEAERLIRCSEVESIILRTSWVYAEHGNNFVKTILRLAKEKPNLQVVNDQWGSPTFANDLAKCILSLIRKFSNHKEIYHFANEGYCSWFEFAQRILSFTTLACEIIPVPSSQYPTIARRPVFSVLDTQKVKQEVQLRSWEEALEECMKKMK